MIIRMYENHTCNKYKKCKEIQSMEGRTNVWRIISRIGKERTMKNERYMMEQHIVPYFGNQMMSEITAGQIIHIFDMDGAYIDNSHIIEGETK